MLAVIEVVGFPDVEGFVIRFLRPYLPGVRVATRVAANPRAEMLPGLNPGPDTFLQPTGAETVAPQVRVSRAGGMARDLAYDAPTVLVECYAASTVVAERLANRARAFLLASARLSDEVTRVSEMGGVAFLPDPDSAQPRYQFVVQLVLKGAPL